MQTTFDNNQKMMDILDYFIHSSRDIIYSLINPIKTVREIKDKVDLIYFLRIISFAYFFHVIIYFITFFLIDGISLLKEITVVSITVCLLAIIIHSITSIFMSIITPVALTIVRLIIFLFSTRLLGLKIKIEQLVGVLVLPLVGISLINSMYLLFSSVFLRLLNISPYSLVQVSIYLTPLITVFYIYFCLYALTENRFKSILAAFTVLIAEIPAIIVIKLIPYLP